MLSLPERGDLIGGKYLIERELGAGGMGTVYAARHQVMDKIVAVKWLRPDTASETAKKRFLREARAVARIRHPNVVDVYDVGEHAGALFLVMEYLEGEPLSAMLERGPLTPRTLVRLLLPAMRGVARAHNEGIVHRDIKPENIFIVRDEEHADGLAKVVDFGISKLSDDSGQSTVTQTGAVVGTPAYMCKEQLNGTKDLDARVDVYAFGVVLYQALSGVLPFGGGSFMSLVMRIATATPPALFDLRPELPAQLCAIVLRAMAREREDRYQSLQELVRVLAEFAVEQGYLSKEDSRAGLASLQPTPSSPWLSEATRSAASSDDARSQLATGPTLASEENVVAPLLEASTLGSRAEPRASTRARSIGAGVEVARAMAPLAGEPRPALKKLGAALVVLAIVAVAGFWALASAASKPDVAAGTPPLPASRAEPRAAASEHATRLTHQAVIPPATGASARAPDAAPAAPHTVEPPAATAVPGPVVPHRGGAKPRPSSGGRRTPDPGAQRPSEEVTAPPTATAPVPFEPRTPKPDGAFSRPSVLPKVELESENPYLSKRPGASP